MDLRTSPHIPSEVLAQFYTAVRITVAVVFFTITREPPAFLVQVGPPLSALATALSPCFIILLVPYYVRLATRRTPRVAPTYVDESVCTDIEEGERTEVEMSEIDISSDETVIHDANWEEEDGRKVDKCESHSIVLQDEIADEAGRDEGDTVEEGSSERNDGRLLEGSDMLSSDETIHEVFTIEEDVGNNERLEEADIEFNDEITRAVDLDEMAVGVGAKLEDNDMVPCGETPDVPDQSTEGDLLRESPPPIVNAHKPSPTPDFPPSGTSSGKRLRAYWDPAPGNEMHILRQTRTFESFYVALESRTRPPWTFG
ncbi:hypothetical protein BDV38DRAFT_287030 [Aspergillus pseudotamarii]|uniref:Uncharacterized protein n=1 Tax=Aspergillus pseudotamarii TaxID=132259 RepID=A0A5N6SHN2_ASPPS|nr:uncharacterized protein BDV38DRAFT_287030 [Aspergillus pseudotamarii]KAE8133171.1 hypothetical protein BDV38DRAFT_287030 [Aspergillus pseudotamarii]